MKTQQQTPFTQAAKPAARHEPEGPRQQQIDASPRQQAQQQRLTQLQAAAQPNGLPAPLHQGLEALSGLAMHDVRVHRNSDKPAQLQADAYAQGRDIYLGPGQERHLAHEAWHIVQQKQGRVSAKRQMPAGVGVNDDPALEQEADRMGARALQAHAEMAPQTLRSSVPSVDRPVQCVIYRGKGKSARDAVKSLGGTSLYKGLTTELEKRWARYLHSEAGQSYSYEEAKAAIAARIESGDAVPDLPEEASTKKRKRKGAAAEDDATSALQADGNKAPKRTKPNVARKTGAATGQQVDYATHEKFRTERRTIRRQPKGIKSVGDKNIYVKRFKPQDGMPPYKLITSSLPPVSLPGDYAKRDIDELAASRLGQSLHSEGVTDQIEQHYAPLSGRDFAAEEAYSTSSREQCEVCRYHHVPHKPGAHYFGTYYSGKTDHIKDEGLRERVVKNKGVIKGLKLTAEERKEVEEADQDAAAARQFDPSQNPLLAKARSALSKEDSDGEHSSDDDDLYVEESLYWGGQGWGKGKVTKIPRREFFDDPAFQTAKARTLELIANKQAPASSSSADTASASEQGAKVKHRKAKAKQTPPSKRKGSFRRASRSRDASEGEARDEEMDSD